MPANRKIRFLCEAGILAACYAVLTYLSSFLGLAYGPMQLRLSEALCVLPVLTPAAVPGLAIGCALGNIGSPYGPIDILVGGIATLAAALSARALRTVLWARSPFLSVLVSSLINALLIGMEICLVDLGRITLPLLLPVCGWVFAGEAAVGLILGLPLYHLLRKSKLFSE